jgi:hypothetical protein
MNTEDQELIPIYGNPLDLNHLSVDKMNFRDIIEQYEGDSVFHIAEPQTVQHHPV